MMLYHVQFEWPDGKANAVMIAENEEKAFQYAEQHLERRLLKIPQIRECYITAKQPLERGRGYIFTSEDESLA